MEIPGWGDAWVRCPAASLLLALTRNHVTIQCSYACVLDIDPCYMMSVNWTELILRAMHHFMPRFSPFKDTSRKVFYSLVDENLNNFEKHGINCE